ncbi:MAG: 30S ribosomal protein S20 [Candidatus Shapirobacteria bacterium]|nr:30S ribosomal protein S20 [Candidatus Shapirobacteria bacterium]
MPVLQSAKKALRRDRRRAVINKSLKDKVKEALKKTRQNPNKKNLDLSFKILDRAAKKKIIHQNKASRLKSRLSKLLKTKKD